MINSTPSDPIVQVLDPSADFLRTLVTFIGDEGGKTPPAYDMPISDLPPNYPPPGNGIPGGCTPDVITSGGSGISMPIACAPPAASCLSPSHLAQSVRSPDQVKPTKPPPSPAFDPLGISLPPSKLISMHTLGLPSTAGTFLASRVPNGISAADVSPAIGSPSALWPMMAFQGNESATSSLSAALIAAGMSGHALLPDVTKVLLGVPTAVGATTSSAMTFSASSSVDWAGVAANALLGAAPRAMT